VIVEFWTPSPKDSPIPVTNGGYLSVDQRGRGTATGRRPQSRPQWARCVCICTQLSASRYERLGQNWSRWNSRRDWTPSGGSRRRGPAGWEISRWAGNAHERLCDSILKSWSLLKSKAALTRDLAARRCQAYYGALNQAGSLQVAVS